MEVLEYHFTCSDEPDELVSNPYLTDEEVPPLFDTFDFICTPQNDAILPQLFIRIVHDCFGSNEFELEPLCRFVCTVRKNYRPVTYHNWQHGFHVAHALWRLLVDGKDRVFTKLEKMALIIGGLCHDIDHRGFNNEFFKRFKHPLAAMYTTSTMEQHHYRQTVLILHAEGHDIFAKINSNDHKELLSLIK